MINLFKGELLPPLFLNEKTEEDIYNFSPRQFILGFKEYESLALSNYQYRILFNSIVNFLIKQKEEDILSYTKDENKSLLFSECLCQFENQFEKILPIKIEILILSCCDIKIKNLLIELIQLQENIQILQEKLKLIPNTLIFGLNLLLYFNLLFKLKLSLRKENKIKIQIDKMTNTIILNASILQWNIAFNYIIEQNDILQTAIKYIKKKTQHIESITNQ